MTQIHDFVPKRPKQKRVKSQNQGYVSEIYTKVLLEQCIHDKEHQVVPGFPWIFFNDMCVDELVPLLQRQLLIESYWDIDYRPNKYWEDKYEEEWTSS